ncbi:hypothetical protein EBX31_08585, partial [bacterium]|nr:hypothetical protein [bacterium]
IDPDFLDKDSQQVPLAEGGTLPFDQPYLRPGLEQNSVNRHQSIKYLIPCFSRSTQTKKLAITASFVHGLGFKNKGRIFRSAPCQQERNLTT